MSIVTAMNCPACEGEGIVGGVECAACDGTGEVEEQSGTALVQEQPAAAPPAGWDGTERRVPALSTDPVTTALAEVTKTNTTITQHLQAARELADRYKGVAFDVRTTKGMEAAKNARLMLRQERYPIQHLQKAGSKMLGAMQKQFNARCDEVTAEIIGYEAPIDDQIAAEEARKDNERREREEAEQRRRQGHIDAIAAIGRHVIEGMGEDSAQLQERIAGVEQIIVDEGYEEYQGPAQQAKDEALRQLQGMLVAARAEEADLEETRRQQAALAAAQAQLEADRRAQAERDRQLAEREAALAEKEKQQRAEAESMARARQERADAVQRRIDGIKWAGEPLDGRSGEELRSIRKTLESLVLSAELLDDRVAEAEREQNARLVLVDRAIAEADEREHQEEQERQAARIEELISNIRGMGENAALAVQDGSADLEGLRAGLEELRGTDLSPEVFGERAGEAARVLTVAASAIEGAIIFTEERDRLRAEAAERQRLQEAEAAAARALADAKRAHGEELYERLRALVMDVERAGIYEVTEANFEAGKAVLLQINPAEIFED